MPTYQLRMTMGVPDWLASWKLLLVASTLFALTTVGAAAWGLATLPDGQGHAADFAGMALLFFGAVGVAVFLVSLPLASLLRRGGPARTAAAAFLVLGGTFVYASSGFFGGFLPVFLLALLVGGLGLHEEHGGVTRANGQ